MKDEIRKLAERIATELFTDGAGVMADRLVLIASERNRGGWGWLPAADRIEKILRDNSCTK